MTKPSRHEKRKARFARKARCAGCGKDIQPADGRACDARGKYRCYPCAAEEEKRAMLRGGRHVLYLSSPDSTGRYDVTNWTGILKFPATIVSKHDVVVFGKQQAARWHVRFTGPDGRAWIGSSPGPGMYCRVRPASEGGDGRQEKERAGSADASG